MVRYPKKVYVVAASDWNYYEIKAIFLHKDKAQAYIDAVPEGSAKWWCLDIEEHKLQL